MKYRIYKKFSVCDNCWGRMETEIKYYPTPNNMSDEDILNFAKEIQSESDSSDKIFIDDMTIREFEIAISKNKRNMEIYIKAILEYRKLKDELEKIVNCWAQAENKVGLDDWNELKITDINYADAEIIATVIEKNNEEGYFTYQVPKDILFDNNEIKKWIKDQVRKKVISDNKYNIELIDEKVTEIENLKREIEEIKESNIDANNIDWEEVFDF